MFKPNYDTPGKGIDPDAPPKKGFALFSEILIREFWTLISLNLLFLITSIPIVTIGAANGAMYHVIIKMMRDEPVDLIPDYKQGFKKNWKQGTQVYLITMVFALVFYTAYMFYIRLHPLIFYVMNSLLFYICMAYLYIYPMLVSVELPLKNIYKNSIRLPLIALPHSVSATVILIAISFVSLMFFPLSFIYILLIGITFSAFIVSFFTYSAIHKYVEFHEDTTTDLLLEEKTTDR